MKKIIALLRFLKGKLIHSLILLALAVISALTFIYSSNTCLNLYIRGTDYLMNYNNYSAVRQLRNIPLNLNPKIFFHEKYLDGLPVYHLLLPDETLDSLDAQAAKAIALGFASKKHKSYLEAAMQYNDTNYIGKIKLHGSTQGNFVGKKRSYNFKMTGSQSFGDFRSFSLINPKQHHHLVPLFANRMAEYLGLYYNQQFPVHLLINHSSYGIYWLEERIDGFFLKRRNLDNAALIKLKDNWIEHMPVAGNFAMNEISGIEPLAHRQEKEVLQRYRELIRAVNEKNAGKLVGFLDLDYMARYEAYRNLFGVCHDICGENLKIFYLPDSNRFYPIMRSEGDLNPIAISGGSTIESYHTYKFLDLEKDANARMFLLLHQHKDFRLLKYQYLHRLSKDFPELYDAFLDDYDSLYNAFRYDAKDHYSVREKRVILANYLPTLKSNMELIDKWLNFSVCYVNIIEGDGRITIEIIPDTELPLEFTKFNLKFKKPFPETDAIVDFYDEDRAFAGRSIIKCSGEIELHDLINRQTIIAEIEDMQLKKTIFRYTIRIVGIGKPELKDFNISVKNYITGQTLTGDRLNVAVSKMGNSLPAIEQ